MSIIQPLKFYIRKPQVSTMCCFTEMIGLNWFLCEKTKEEQTKVRKNVCVPMSEKGLFNTVPSFSYLRKYIRFNYDKM